MFGRSIIIDADSLFQAKKRRLRVIFLFITARKVARGDYDTGRRGFFTWQKGRYEIIETMGLYWHFVDLVWVFIFAFFYLW